MKTIVSKKLKQLREANGYTQDLIASYLGINRSTYSNYESGDREPPVQLLEKLSDLYGCDLILFYDEQNHTLESILSTAFRIDAIQESDLNEIANFKKAIKNYLKMNILLKNGSLHN